jgi:hypothetical protein
MKTWLRQFSLTSALGRSTLLDVITRLRRSATYRTGAGFLARLVVGLVGKGTVGGKRLGRDFLGGTILSAEGRPPPAKRRTHIVPPRKRAWACVRNLRPTDRPSDDLPAISSPSGRDIVPSGKPPASVISSGPGKYSVLSGKPCRPTWEGTSSCWGRHIVSSGKLYRPVGENLSSCSGIKLPFLLQKRIFPWQDRQVPCICLC